jgi:PIN domain nuclease of toxin-antitoxin system
VTAASIPPSTTSRALLIRSASIQRSFRNFCADLFSHPAYQPLDLTPEQINEADSARPNRDPFDALICAAARHLHLPLLTRDVDFRRSGLVEVIW